MNSYSGKRRPLLFVAFVVWNLLVLGTYHLLHVDYPITLINRLISGSELAVPAIQDSVAQLFTRQYIWSDPEPGVEE